MGAFEYCVDQWGVFVVKGNKRWEICVCLQTLSWQRQLWRDTFVRLWSEPKRGKDTSSLTWRSKSRSRRTVTGPFCGPRCVSLLTCFRRSRSKTLTLLCSQAMVLCHFLDTHRDEYNLMDKSIIELGAGTGLVTIVTSLLGESSQSERALVMQEYLK